MIINLDTLLTPIHALQTYANKSVLQMDMPMHMTDMWIWLIALVAIIALAVAVPLTLSSRPNRRTPSPAPAYTQIPIIPSNSEAAVVPQKTDKPMPKTHQLKRALELVRPTLTDDERRVLNEVVKAGGEILQSDLPRKSDFSKATVSKLVRSLETMGVVTRQKYKWTYWIKLSDKLISESKNA